ncbi:MAG TPA: tetratricopeptide repeat protein [Casimicrobiaceae bacterium]
MTAHASAEWLARGRSHQQEGRPVDAMLCFRRALREAAQSADVRFHLGEVLWQMGRLSDAIALWRETAELSPQHVASHQALTEALLGTGEYVAAADVANRVLALVPNNARAVSIKAIAALWSSDDSDAANVLCATIVRHPELLTFPVIGGSLALALDRQPALEAREKILDVVTAMPPDVIDVASMPALLLALTLERLAKPIEIGIRTRDAWIEGTLARPWAVGDHDALRRAAFVVTSLAPRDGLTLAQHYAAICMRVDTSGVPLIWPRRTRGERPRVVVLAAGDDVVSQSVLRPLREKGVDVTLIPTDTDDTRVQRLAAYDADAVIDLAGLAAPVGVMIAQRPARTFITVATLRTRNHAPLIEEVAEDARALVEAIKHLQSRIEHGDSDMPDAAAMNGLWANAIEAHRAGGRETAKAQYERVLELQPTFAPAHYLLGVTLRDEGQIDLARKEFGAALASAPRYVSARVDAIRAAIAADDLDDAGVLADQSVALTDDPSPPLLRALGLVSLAAHDGERAAAWFEKALMHEPVDGETHYNHGVALQMQRRFGDAARAYQRALACDPALIAADFNLGTIFADQGNRDAAIAAFSAVISRDPRHVAAYKNRGELLFATGRIDAWRANFRDFETNCPDALPLAVHALEVCQYYGEFERVDDYLAGLRNERFKSKSLHELGDSLEELLYVLLYFDVEPELIHRFARTYDHAARSVYGAPLGSRTERRPGKLRVGYLSADLRNHVMGKMMWQAVRCHDRERFAISFYSLSTDRDEWTRRFEATSDRFEVLAGLGERQAAERIAADDLDVLVDLSTHTKGARPGILALKPARVQITHVASAGTLGLSAVDFKLTDRYADLEENQRYQIEALLPMEGCVYPYRHIDVASGTQFRREAFGIPAGAIVIGSFVSALKLSRRCLSLWRQVLEQIPAARLAFSPVNPALATLYAKLIAAAGIDAERIVFLPQAPTDSENQSRYALVDFVLDPMPYGGVNGTLEALDMGVPVVTLVGKRHAERTSYSILSNLGVTQTIAHTGNEYVAIATRLAQDNAFMNDVRASIRAGISHSPLTDMQTYTRNLEAAYIDALRLKAPSALSAASVVAATL